MKLSIPILVALLASGCASYPVYNAPKYVTADGASYSVCSGSVIVNTDSWFGETTFAVSFTARYKWDDTHYYEDDVFLRGVRKLEITESALPNNLCNSNLTRH